MSAKGILVSATRWRLRRALRAADVVGESTQSSYDPGGTKVLSVYIRFEGSAFGFKPSGLLQSRVYAILRNLEQGPEDSKLKTLNPRSAELDQPYMSKWAFILPETPKIPVFFTSLGLGFRVPPITGRNHIYDFIVNFSSFGVSIPSSG